MKLRYALLFFLCVITGTAFSQKNFQSGFVITIKGDTIRGQINNLIWEQSPASIAFTGPNGPTTYQPEDLLSFSAGEHTYYKSYKVKYDSTGGAGATRREFRSPTFTEEHVFLRVLVDSHYSLLMFRKGFQTHYFIQENGETPEELISHPFEMTIAGQTLAQPGNQYVQQLRTKLGECGTVKVKDDLRYLRSTLMDLLTEYNDCRKTKVRIPGEEPKRLYGGLTASATYDIRITYGSGYATGVFIGVNFPKKLYRNTWVTEVVYRKFGGGGEFGTLRINTMIKAQFLHSTTRPFLVAGAGRSFISEADFESYKYVAGHSAFFLGYGMYPTRALSAELRLEITTPMVHIVTKTATIGYGSGCLSGGLILAYHFRLNK